MEENRNRLFNCIMTDEVGISDTLEKRLSK